MSQTDTGRRRAGAILAGLLLAAASGAAAGADPVQVRTLPAAPLVEAGRHAQLLNFDFVLRNDGAQALDLNRIRVTAYDRHGRPTTVRQIDKNGFPSSLETIPRRSVAPGQTLGVFNPFFAFPPDMDVTALTYEFGFSSSDGPRLVSYSVRPIRYVDKTRLRVPLKGRLLIVDGHDFYAHHRRQDISDPRVAAMGVTANPVRYAIDIVYVDEHGAMYHGDPREERNWIGYGAPVYAPGDGRVAALVNDVGEPSLEGDHVKVPRLPPDASPFGMGNYVEIDHGDGEFSVVAHLMPGSVSVKVGQRVRAGDVVGRLGASDAGDPTYPVEPHVHFMLMGGPALATSEGLPAYFGPYRLFRGTHWIPVQRGRLDTGDIFEVD